MNWDNETTKKWLSATLEDRDYHRLLRIVTLLGYKDEKDFFESFYECMVNRPPQVDSFFKTDFYRKETAARRPLPFFKQVMADLGNRTADLKAFPGIKEILVKRIYEDLYSSDETSIDELISIIQVEKAFRKSVKGRLENEFLILHLELLCERKKLNKLHITKRNEVADSLAEITVELKTERNKSEKRTSVDEKSDASKIYSSDQRQLSKEDEKLAKDIESDIKFNFGDNHLLRLNLLKRSITKSILLESVEDSLSYFEESSYETINKCEEYPALKAVPSIIPAPRIKKGLLGNLLGEITDDLVGVTFLDSSLPFLQLFDDTIHTIPQKVEWDSSVIHLVYLLVLMADKSIISKSEILRLTKILPSTILSKDKNGKCSDIKRRTVSTSIGRVSTMLLTTEDLPQDYMQIRSIVMRHYTKALESNSSVI